MTCAVIIPILVCSLTPPPPCLYATKDTAGVGRESFNRWRGLRESRGRVAVRALRASSAGARQQAPLPRVLSAALERVRAAPLAVLGASWL